MWCGVVLVECGVGVGVVWCKWVEWKCSGV